MSAPTTVPLTAASSGVPRPRRTDLTRRVRRAAGTIHSRASCSRATSLADGLAPRARAPSWAWPRAGLRSQMQEVTAAQVTTQRSRRPLLTRPPTMGSGVSLLAAADCLAHSSRHSRPAPAPFAPGWTIACQRPLEIALPPHRSQPLPGRSTTLVSVPLIRVRIGYAVRHFLGVHTPRSDANW
jgi:hypothetical protein